MFILLVLCIGFVLTDSIPSRYYFSGYRYSFKAIRHRLPNTNLILSSPHAGSDLPSDIPDRSVGGCQRNNSMTCTFHFNDTCSDGTRCPVTTVQDFGSFDPFVEWVAEELYRKYNLLPFVIVAQWNRQKIDYNREISEATFNHPKAMTAHQRYHHYLQKAVNKIEKKYQKKGLLLDIHQHGQGNYTMIGIRLSAAQLNNNNLSPTSVESLIELSCPQNRSECIQGSKSLGTFFEANGLGISYPSLHNPKPNNKTFYKGGYITNTYSSQINVIQTELPYMLRNGFDPKIYVEKYVDALINFMKINQLL